MAVFNPRTKRSSASTLLSLLSLLKWYGMSLVKKGILNPKLEKHIAFLKKQKVVDSSIDGFESILNDSKLLDTLGMEINPFSDAVIDSILIDKKAYVVLLLS
jgi:hypothetical protein